MRTQPEVHYRTDRTIKMEMIQILNRIQDYRRNHPEKYERICHRLDEMLDSRTANQSSAEQPGTSGTTKASQGYPDEAETLEKLILLDVQNRKYWTGVERAWRNPETENHYKDHQEHTRRERSLNFSLAQTLFVSDDPEALFTRMCLYNSPDKVSQYRGR
ncbi:hypothetical protein RvY_07515 [Ramazzottius varieornatus]|uniref:Uncharacterized protein n=1 Tax=Ramazzottius varieornatus TaxID=947166 RepID=A0A1D1V8J3_RAMVA|nr:hypothetical protein RvY_07515 [Ramazzottius varieornatus]